MATTSIIEGMVQYDRPSGKVGWRNYSHWFLFINQGWRDAEVIAQTESDFLFEYEMPGGKSFLYEISINDFGYFKNIGKSINRKRLPVKWRGKVNNGI